MKVIVILEIEVDKDEYNLDYGQEASATDIRYDVRQTARESVEYQNLNHPWFKSVKLRNP